MSKTTEFFCNHWPLIGAIAGVIIGIVFWCAFGYLKIEDGRMSAGGTIGPIGEYYVIGEDGYNGWYEWKGEKVYEITIG